MKATAEMFDAVLETIWDHAKRLAEHDLTIAESDRKWIGDEPEVHIDREQIILYWHEHWNYGGEEDHYFSMNPSEVFAEDPMAIIEARNAKVRIQQEEAQKAQELKTQKHSEAAKKAAETRAKNQEEHDRAEFERLSKKFGDVISK